MMEPYLLWRLSLVLMTVLASSGLVAVYKLANKVLHRRDGKGCAR